MMWIESIYLDDFGCFDRAHLHELSPQLNLICGPQRAGKTTLLHALRALGYGISRTADSPPATVEYNVGAIVSRSSGTYRIDLNGYASPQVHPVNATTPLPVSELYGNIPRVQYQQLFTISLDELQMQPASIESDEELLEVLIGGGFGDAMKIPVYRDDFAKRAMDIAGKHGRAVYELKSSAEQIQSGLSALKEANQHVDQYAFVNDELSDLEERISELEEEREQKYRIREQLRRIASRFPEIKNLETHQRHLSSVNRDDVLSFPLHLSTSISTLFDQWSTVQSEITELRSTLSGSQDDHQSNYPDDLVDNRDQIETLTSTISGIRERYDRYCHREKQLNDRERNLLDEIRSIWGIESNEINRLTSIECDQIARERVRTTVESYTQAQRDVDRLNDEITSTRDHLDAIDTEISEISTSVASNRDRSIARFVLTTVIAGAIGYIGMSITQPIVGIILAISVLAVVGIVILRGFAGSQEQLALQTLEADRRSEQASLSRLQLELDRSQSNIQPVRERYNELCEILLLPHNTAPQVVLSTYDEIRDLQREYRRIAQHREDLNSRKTTLKSDVTAITNILIALDRYDHQDEYSLQNLEQLIAPLERVGEDLDRALALRTAENRLAAHEQELIKLLSHWDEIDTGAERTTIQVAVETYLDRVDEVRECREHIDEVDRISATLETVFEKRVLCDVADKLNIDLSTPDTVSRLQEIIASFGNVSDIRAECKRIELDLVELDETIDSARDDRAELTHRLSALRSPDEILDAHTTINNARTEFVELGESYAVNRFAAFFLDTLYEQYIDKTTGPLLREAGEIFSRITAGAYCGIRSETVDGTVLFEVDRPDAAPQQVEELSRGTIEQLFLSIRIARIRRFECSLPVILDDTFVNFDPAHRRRAVSLINELTADNQVFLLTCHPEIVDVAVNRSRADTYWTVESGRFTRESDPEAVKAVLESM